jgi:purine catabolism regulator
VAVRYGHLLYQTSPVTRYTDLGAYHLLFEMQEKGINLEAFYRSALGSLAITGKKENNPLLTTLDIYLLYNLNMKEASEVLYIHRHTMKYRLQQIEKKTGRSLSSPHDRLQLHLAVMAYKMLNKPNPV